MQVFTWLGIIFCLSQSAIFSGLNIAIFSLSRLKLEIEAKQGNKHAIRVLKLRQDSNYLLTTILWGNVGINVLLTLLSNSVMVGLVSFAFSTFLITLFGEILPQAYFSRHALKVAYLLSPILRFYQILLSPISRPTALLLNKLIGHESIQYFREASIKEFLEIHIESSETDLGRVEGAGALNFLTIDDLNLSEEGELIDPLSIIELPFKEGVPVLPKIDIVEMNEFSQKIFASGKKWVIITDGSKFPQLVLNTDHLLRILTLKKEEANPHDCCYRPVVISGNKTKLGEAISMLEVQPKHAEDDLLDKEVLLLWNPEEKRIITGSDLLGRLLRGIAKRK